MKLGVPNVGCSDLRYNNKKGWKGLGVCGGEEPFQSFLKAKGITHVLIQEAFLEYLLCVHILCLELGIKYLISYRLEVHISNRHDFD